LFLKYFSLRLMSDDAPKGTEIDIKPVTSNFYFIIDLFAYAK